jgi:hypothetical protein
MNDSGKSTDSVQIVWLVEVMNRDEILETKSTFGTVRKDIFCGLSERYFEKRDRFDS